jgi:hypothetical protein
LDLEKVKKKLATSVLVDGGNAFDREATTKAELTYRGVGKGRRDE